LSKEPPHTQDKLILLRKQLGLATINKHRR
jgi:hypothetical protein